MTEITKSITFLNEYKQLKKALEEGKTPVLAVGLAAIHKANLAAALGADLKRPLLVLTDDDNAANRFAADLRGFSEREVVVLPSRELVMADVAGVSRGYEQARLASLAVLPGAAFAVASVQAAAQRTMPPELLRSSVVTLTAGESAPRVSSSSGLVSAGYERCAQVEGAGQFSVRGGILDIFPPQSANPYRVEFWDDEIDSISTFDVGSQRRLEQCDTLRCLPCMETIPALAKGGAAGLAKAVLALVSTRRKKQHAELQKNLERDAERLRESGTLPAADKYMPLIYPEITTAFDYLPENTLVLIEDTPRLRDAARDFHARIADDVTALMERGEMPGGLDGYALDFAGICGVKRQIVRLDSFLNNVSELAPQHLENFVANQMNAYGGNLDMASADIRSYTEQGRAVAVVCGSELRCRNMLDALTDSGLRAQLSDLLPKGGCVNIMEGTLSAGFEYPDLGLVVMTEGQVLARRKKAKVKRSNRDRVKSFTDLTPGDLVVHEHHGIGRFIGMERMTVDGSERDFIKIAFAGTDFLYVPATS
ncbi:MAG: transcription-repair coupling factor, partial [Butyricicoccus sp.]|nr:transcription-repair coupling factor [Butyricicoccus sp.]